LVELAAVGKHGALPDLGEIGQKRYPVLVVDLRADRHFENRIGAVGAVTILAHAGPAVGGGKMLLVAIIDERVEAVDRLRDHVAALSAIAAVRPAEFNELLSPKRDAAIAAVAGANVNLGLVEKFHLHFVNRETRRHNINCRQCCCGSRPCRSDIRSPIVTTEPDLLCLDVGIWG
jgi:hypothetical protein